MKYKPVWSKLTGKPGKGTWSQAYDFKPEDQTKLAEKGHLFAIISTIKQGRQGNSEVDLEGVNQILMGKEVLTRLHEEYFGKTGENPLTLLKNSVETVFAEFSNWEGVEIAAASLVGEAVYLVCGGGSKIYILRDGILSTLIKSQDGKVRSASGYIKKDDILLMGTNSFFNEFAVGVLKALLQSYSPESFADQLAPQMQSKEDSGDLAVAAIKFEEEVAAIETELKTAIADTPETGYPKNEGTQDNGQIFVPADPVAMEHASRRLGVNEIPQQPVIGDEIKIRKSGNLMGTKINTGAGDFFKNFIKQRLYIDDSETTPEVKRRRKVSASVGIVLLLVLFVSIFFGIRQKDVKEIRQSYEEDLNFARHTLSESQNLIGLNPDRARELYLEGNARVLGISDRGIDNPEITDVINNYEEARGQILGEYKVSPENFVDLSLLTEGFNGSESVYTDGMLYILDKIGRKIVKVFVASGRAEVVAGPEMVADAITISGYIDNLYTITSSGVYDVMEDKKIVLAEEFSENILVRSFAGNLYILDKSTSMITRYSGSDETFGDGVKWLKEGTTTDLSNAISLAIDGNIWVLDSDGNVYRFSLGNPQTFKLSDSFISDFKPEMIFTSDETESLYLLDKDRGSVFVFDKEGNYVSQYLSEEIKNTTNIAVSEKDKKMLLLNGGKLLSVNLMHLD